MGCKDDKKAEGSRRSTTTPYDDISNDLDDLDLTEQDLESLNDQLDELILALDVLEKKNENIQAKIKEFLQADDLEEIKNLSITDDSTNNPS